MTGLLASLLLAVLQVPQPFLAKDATAEQLVSACRTRLPATAELSGRLLLVNRKGIVKAEHTYVLRRTPSGTSLEVDGTPQASSDAGARIAGTDVTWSDLTLDYLMWTDYGFDPELKEENLLGVDCARVLLRRGERTIRAWVSYRFGALMRAEELKGGEVVRQLWATRVKTFGDRQMPNLILVETVGSGHRTKITVEELK